MAAPTYVKSDDAPDGDLVISNAFGTFEVGDKRPLKALAPEDGDPADLNDVAVQAELDAIEAIERKDQPAAPEPTPALTSPASGEAD